MGSINTAGLILEGVFSKQLRLRRDLIKAFIFTVSCTRRGTTVDKSLEWINKNLLSKIGTEVGGFGRASNKKKLLEENLGERIKYAHFKHYDNIEFNSKGRLLHLTVLRYADRVLNVDTGTYKNGAGTGMMTGIIVYK
jgi:hypothetical protein